MKYYNPPVKNFMTQQLVLWKFEDGLKLFHCVLELFLVLDDVTVG